jgi:hypothetical protein
MNIQSLCNYLEQIGMIDQNSIKNFLSIFSLITQKKFSNYNQKVSNTNIYVNALSSYLKNILSIDDNFKIFAHKIIKKYSQNLLIKQYSSINTMFIIFNNRLKIEKFSCFLFLKKYSENKKINNFNKKQKQKPKYLLDIKKSLSLQNLYSTKEDEYLQTKYSEFNTSNYLNYSNFTSNKPKHKITAQSMFLKRQNQLMNKIRKEHNIKFKKPKINNLSCEPSKKMKTMNVENNIDLNNINNLKLLEFQESRNSLSNGNLNYNSNDDLRGNSLGKLYRKNKRDLYDYNIFYNNFY